MGVKSSAAWVSREHAGATWEPLVASGVAPRVVVIERVRLGLQRLAGLWMLPLPLWMVAASSGPPAVALLGLYALPCALIGILAGLICEPSTEPSTAPPSSPMAAATLLLVASLAAAGVLRHFGGVIVFDLTPFAVCRPLLTGASAQGLTLLAAQSVLLWILAGCSYRMAVAGLRRRMTRP